MIIDWIISLILALAVGLGSAAPVSSSGGGVGTALVAITGRASQADESHPSNYLAMRLPRGTKVTLCGHGGCWVGLVNDYGPSSKIRPRRIADIALKHWLHVCGISQIHGTCKITASYELGQHPKPTPPPTDTE